MTSAWELGLIGVRWLILELSHPNVIWFSTKTRIHSLLSSYDGIASVSFPVRDVWGIYSWSETITDSSSKATDMDFGSSVDAE